MKHVFKLLGTSLVAASLLLTACTKKPVRNAPDSTAVGNNGNNGINPEAVALPGEQINLQQRESGTPEGQSVVEPIYFALDRYAVAAPERGKLDAAIKWLKDNPEKSLVLVGHCDWRGTAEYNLGLGDRRANAVKRYLESLGADAKRLETLSKGSTDSKQSATEAEWSKDRRVDFVELKKQ
jgi:peptidoglycan-associated lipoprotein